MIYMRLASLHNSSSHTTHTREEPVFMVNGLDLFWRHVL